MIRVDVVYALIYKEDEKKVLMVNNKGGSWSLPGGAVKRGETLEKAVIREVKEETNLNIEVGEIVAINEAMVKEKGHHAIFFTFNAKIIDGEISVVNKDEIIEIEWVNVERANELMPYYPEGVESLLEASSPYTFQG